MVASTSATKIERLQKRALCFVFDDFTSDYNTLLSKANASTMFLCRLRRIATEVYKCIYNSNVHFMNDMFETKDNINHLRRNHNVAQLKFSTIRYGKSSFKYISSHIWNMLPVNLEQAENINCFRKLIKTWTGPNYRCNMCNSVSNS